MSHRSQNRCRFCEITKGAFVHVSYGYHYEKSSEAPGTRIPRMYTKYPTETEPVSGVTTMASSPTESATKSDKWRDDPENLYVLGIDGDDEKHPFHSAEQVQRALAAESDEAWITDLGASGVHTSVKMYRLAKHRGQPNAPIFVLVGHRRVMGLRAVNVRRKQRGLAPFEIPFEMYTLTDESEVADRKAYRVYMSENEGRAEDTMEMRARKAFKFVASAEEGGFGGPRGDTEKKEEDRVRLRRKECAESMEVTDTQVANLLNFLKAEAPVRAAAAEKKIPESAVPSLAKLSPEEQVKALPKMIEDFAKGTVTVKDTERQVRNAKRASKGQEPVAPLPGRRVWAKLVDMVNKGEIALAKPAQGKGKDATPEVKGIDHAVYQMAQYLASGENVKSVPYLSGALRKAGFEVSR